MPRAPKICNEKGCTALVYEQGKRKCDEHYVPWQGKAFDKRRADTDAHRRMKARILGRAGYQCQIRRMDRCTQIATQVDRVDNARDYSDDNCRAACTPCHQWHTSMEGHAARGHSTGE